MEMRWPLQNFTEVRLSTGEMRLVIGYSVHIRTVISIFSLIHWKISYSKPQAQTWDFPLLVMTLWANSCFKSSMRMKTQLWFSWWKQYLEATWSVFGCPCLHSNIYGCLFLHYRLTGKNVNLFGRLAKYFHSTLCRTDTPTNQQPKPRMLG